MKLIAPDLLSDVIQLSVGLNAFGYFIGLMLWCFGQRWHRFWVVMAITTAAGVLGLLSGRALGGQLMVMGILLAIAGGLLAMELARLGAFVAGGFVVWYGARTLAPGAHDLTLAFFLGGLLSLLLYRFWTMLLTSFLGTMLATYCGFGLVSKFLKMDVVALAEGKALWVNLGVLIVTAMGFALQSRLNRASGSAKSSVSKSGSEDATHAAEPKAKPKKAEGKKESDGSGKGWLPFPKKAA